MEAREAVALLEGAVRGRDGAWADIGAGTGTFTRALVELLGADSRIYAVDRDASVLKELQRWAARDAPNVTAVSADFARPFSLPALNEPLDGMLLANALHFVRDQDEVLARLVTLLRPGGRVVFVEYDRRAASRWVPFPIPRSRLESLATAAGLTTPVITGTRPSEYQGVLYAAWGDVADLRQSQA
jgi:ubiquinone/menaquinone biosynthesis C-methylase UbiE